MRHKQRKMKLSIGWSVLLLIAFFVGRAMLVASPEKTSSFTQTSLAVTSSSVNESLDASLAPDKPTRKKKEAKIRKEWTGNVVGVSDGDTITALTEDKNPIKIRLYGVDAPEKAQAFGSRAKQFVSDMCYRQNVDVLEIDTDRYGRTVALIRLGKNPERLLQEELLKNGFVWVYAAYCREPYLSPFLELEKTARESHVGLWADKNPTPPWEFRKGKRKKSEVDLVK